ncbi:RUN and FYVE domain-containing protein 4 [Carlito syrichta]|uniref:RUN and FYVE domain-containing protein 4 n=1 Tax=Carlito syrichta TaxID=1868482 RepID=A0A1U7V188_CARSF|nr:RUN and FYVE domain-containing protein 4 [Carlito syrichta]
MAEEGAMLKVTEDLKAAVSAILQGYGDGQGPVTDASAELHRLCGCLELLLQFDQKEQKSFLGSRKDYWNFLCTALRRQRGDMQPACFIHSLDKLKTPLGKGRAFIRFCLAHGQLAESLQLCLLDPELTREWYGPWSPLLCPELREDILDSLYTLNGVTFNLDLQWPDLDGAWPMFSESRCSKPSRTQGRRPRKNKDTPKVIPVTYGDPKGVWLEEPHASQASCPQNAPKGHRLAGPPGSQPHKHLPPILEQKKSNFRSLRLPQNMWEPEGEEPQLDQEQESPWTGIFLENSTPSTQGQREGAMRAQEEEVGVEAEGRGVLLGVESQRTIEKIPEGEAEWGRVHRLLDPSPTQTREAASPGSRQEWERPSILGEFLVPQGLGTKEGSTTEKTQEQTEVTSVARREEQAEVALRAVVESLSLQHQKVEEQAQRQGQMLREQEGELQDLRKQLSRCQEERTQLQAQLEQKQQEAERRDAMYQEELGGQQDLVRAMKRRVLELIQEKDHLWQRLQHLSSVAPGCCVSCGKIFGRLSRRYPCRLCGGLLCHACSADYKKRERCCPPCAQGAQVTQD